MDSNLSLTINKRQLRNQWFANNSFPAGTVFSLMQESEIAIESIRGAIVSFESSEGGLQSPIGRYVYVGQAPSESVGLPIFKWDRLELTSSEIRELKIYPIFPLVINMQLREGIYSK